MPHWLVKSEPNCFSWDQHAARGVEPWTGVRNHLAKRHLCDMRLGELALFYHSTTGREAVGLVEVVREAYPDPTDPDGRWVCVDLRAVAPLPRPVPLAAMKAHPGLADLPLLRQSRLSVSPVGEEHWHHLLRLGGWPE